MAALLADPIAIPTQNPLGRREFVEVLEKQTEKLGFEFTRLEPPSRPGAMDEVPDCFLASHGHGTPFYFRGPNDVVPAQSAEQFQPQRKDHFVFGRGASDMKAGIVSMPYAIVGLKDCDVEMDGKISFVLVLDEETGSARPVTLTDRDFFPLRTVRTNRSISVGWLNAPRSRAYGHEGFQSKRVEAWPSLQN